MLFPFSCPFGTEKYVKILKKITSTREWHTLYPFTGQNTQHYPEGRNKFQAFLSILSLASLAMKDKTFLFLFIGQNTQHFTLKGEKNFKLF